jgi:CubicO group peptidase (beta-lactamase class C family)
MQPRALAERITPRHLLTHSAGFANPVPVRWIHPADQPGPDQADLLAGFFNLIRIYPAQAVGIAIMGNATNYPIDAIARLALART